MISCTEDGSVKAPKTLRPISYFGSIWKLHVLDLKTKVFVGKRTSYIFPWTRDTQCQKSGTVSTLAKTEIIYPKNVGALVAMNFT